MDKDIDILQQHINKLYITSKDGDKTVAALRRILNYLINQTKDEIQISSDSDLLIVMQKGELSVFEKGNKLDMIEELKFNYNKEEVSSIEIKQYI